VSFFNTNPSVGGDLLSGLTSTQLRQIANWNFGVSFVYLWEGNPFRPDSFDTALTNLGVPHITYNESQFATFNAAVATANPTTEMVIASSPSVSFSDSNNITNFVNSGGRAILSVYFNESLPSTVAAFQAGVAGSIGTPVPVYDWGGSNLFNGVPNPITFSDLWGDDGDRLNPTSGSAVAGFVPATTTNQAAIVVGNGGRTIINGFIFDDITSTANATLVAQNEIQYVSGVVAPPAATLTATVDGSGNLVITDVDGVGKNNQISVSVVGGNLVITDTAEQFQSAPAGGSLSNGNKTLTIPLANPSAPYSAIIFNTNAGNDVLTVDSSMAASGKPITLNGGNPTSGPPGDAMVLSGPGTFANITHSFTNAADGSVNIDGYAVSYFGLEPVTDTITATSRTFTFTGIGEIVTLADSGAAGDTMSTISSTQGESVAFANPTGTLTVNLTSGTDTLNFNSLDSMEAGPAAFSADIFINGDGSDIVNFPSTVINLGAGTANIGTTGGQPPREL